MSKKKARHKIPHIAVGPNTSSCASLRHELFFIQIDSRTLYYSDKILLKKEAAPLNFEQNTVLLLSLDFTVLLVGSEG